MMLLSERETPLQLKSVPAHTLVLQEESIDKMERQTPCTFRTGAHSLVRIDRQM